MVLRSAAAVVVLSGLFSLARCGGDDTATVTTTVTGGGETTQTTTEDETTTTTDDVEDCTSKAAPNVTDLSVRNMTCEEADALTSEVIQSLSRRPFTAAGFECEILGRSGPDNGPILGAEGIRCASGDRAFRFSFGD